MSEDKNIERAKRSISEKEIEGWFLEEERETDAQEGAGDGGFVDEIVGSQARIVRSNYDFSIAMFKDFQESDRWINLSPDYQRRNRWDDAKRSKLIESILMNIPIPPLFLFENRFSQYEVMDGRQRLSAIVDFLDNKYSLKGMEFWSQLDDLCFEELPHALQASLTRRTLSAVVLLSETERVAHGEDIRLIIFRRLNTGGVKLNPQELRNAVYPGRFNDLIKFLARNEAFANAWGLPLDNKSKLVANPLYNSMADAELVLRFFAIRDTVEFGLKGSLRKILDSTMQRYQSAPLEQLKEMESDFSHSIQSLSELFHGEPFRLPNGRVSRPLYDALMVAFDLNDVKLNAEAKKRVRSRLIDYLANDETYEVLVGRGNTVDAILERVGLATEILAA